MRFLSRHRAIAVCALATLLGCSDDPMGPSETLDIRFEGTMIGDRGLPYLETITEGPFAGCQRMHTGGHVILYGSGTFEVVLDTWHDLCDGELSGGASHGLGTGTYHLDGDELVLNTDFGSVTAELFRGQRIDEHRSMCPTVRLEWSGKTYGYAACVEPF